MSNSVEVIVKNNEQDTDEEHCSVHPEILFNIASTDWLKYLNQLSGQRLSLISPLKGFSHRTVEVFDKLQNAVFKLSLTGEARTPQ